MSIDNSSGGIVAGWYADPADASQMRYWDGNGWTERTAPLATAQPAAPVAPQVAAPAAAAVTVAAASPFDDLTTAMTPAPVSSPSDEFGGGFAPAAPAVAQPAVPAAAVGAVASVVPATAGSGPVYALADTQRPTDPALAKSARMVSRIFNIIALVVLVLGILGGILVAIAGLVGLTTVSNSDYWGMGILGAIIAGVMVIIYAVIAWAFWKLLSLVAGYIALRSE